MDERLRHLEQATRTGDPEATTRLHGALRRSGRPAPTPPLEERVRLGLFDTFSTRLREDIVEAARATAEEGARFSEEVNLDPAWCPVELQVNSQRLCDLAGGDFGPHLPAHAVYLPTRHLLGAPYAWPGGWSPLDEDGKTALLFCGCGDAGCGRLLATVKVTADTVTWADLEERPKPRPLGDLAFVFRRRDYEAALRDPPPDRVRRST